MKTVKVIHSLPTWLQQTEVWLYNQVKFLPPDIESYIICEATANLDQFNLPNIYNVTKKSILKSYLEKILNKLNWESNIKSNIKFILKKTKEIGAKILHSHYGPTGWYNIRAKKAGLKHFVTFYGYDINFLPKQNPIWFKRYKKLFKEIDTILCEGSHMGSCIEKLGCPKEKIKIHHLGVNLGLIPFKPRLWNTNEPLKILLAGSFRQKKGIPYALEALGQLQKEVKMQITIIGDAGKQKRDILEKEKILKTIEKYNMKSIINLLGYQPYSVLFKEIYNNHIFLSPSITSSDGDTEGGAPVTIIEAAASGMPVVSTKHCDIPEVLKNDVKAFLSDERDIEGIVDNLRWLISNSQSWLKILKNSRYYVKKEYNASIQSKKLVDIYQKI